MNALDRPAKPMWFWPGRPLKMREICVQVAEKHGISTDELKSQSRDARLIPARHEFYFRCVREAELSLGQIGAFMGRHHSTILWGVNKHASRIGA